METALFEDQDMPLRNEDKAWIANEIRAAIQEHLQPHGWRKFVHWLREWGLVATVPTVILSLLGLVATAGYYAFSRVRQETEFQTHTTDTLGAINNRLDAIESALRTLRASQSPGRVLQELSKLDQKTFAKSLPAVQKVGEQPPIEVKPSQETLRAVADKLRNTSPQNEGYWPAVLQFLNFASAGLSVKVPPPGPASLVISNNKNFAAGVVRNRVVLLDGGEIVKSRFENSRIIFTNNPVKFQNVTFVDCVFQLPVTNSPNDYLKKASQVLLASALNSATFNSQFKP